jgi:serine protease Do
MPDDETTHAPTPDTSSTPPVPPTPTGQVIVPPPAPAPVPQQPQAQKPRTPRSGTMVFGPIILLIMTVLVSMYLAPRIGRQIAWEAADARITRVRAELDDATDLRTLSEAFRLVAEGMRDSVVHIKAFQNNGAAGNGTGYETPQHVGNGSGWVYQYHGPGESEGRCYLITNYHVIREASYIVVRFADGQEHKASPIGADAKTDIAVLQLALPPDVLKRKHYLHPAKLALDDEGELNVEQGDIVFAFGSPFRFEFSVSQGVISAKGRKGILRQDGSYESFIQTDAAINPGNSGGPLTNVHGRVIGMNTAIATRDGGSDGLGFAIPVDMIKKIADQIISDQVVKRGFLGIFIATATRKQAGTFGFRHVDERGGVIVENTMAGGPAAQSDVQHGDIIHRVDDQRVTDADELRGIIADKVPNTTVQLHIFRDGDFITVDVTLGELPDRRVVMDIDTTDAPGRGLQGEDLLQFFGFQTLTDVTKAEALRRGAGAIEGILVVQVRPNSIADAAQGGPIDDLIITHVADAKVTTTAQFIAELEKFSPGKIIRLTVQRGSYIGFRYLEWPLD